jgi:predicted site-specific integrase-resolvase
MAALDHSLPSSNPPPRRESWRKKADRHGVSTRTLDRWVEKGIIEKPTIIRGRKYGAVDEEPRTDAA